MAGLAGYAHMLPGQLEGCQGVVKGCPGPAGCAVAGGAVRAKAAIVLVTGDMTGHTS